MPALVAGIHVFAAVQRRKTWMAGTSPAMTYPFGEKHRRKAVVESHFIFC
jgi:hypothetical protein